MQARNITTTDQASTTPMVGRLNLAHDGAWVSIDVQVCPNGCIVAADRADRHRKVCGR